MHSTYIRKPLDASILSKPVQLKIQAKNFFCLNSNCKRQIFTERFNGFLNVHRRLTVRLEEVFLQLSLSMSAEALSRFLFKLGYERSGDSLLDLLRRIDSTEKEIKNQSLTHIGVDDFSFRRGVDFGTVICDLKTHRPVEILASRSTQAFKEWLEKHPSVEVVTRDRATTYTKAIHSTNPDIIQIADKWHFLKNLLDVVKETISSRFPKGWFIIPESPVIETTDNETDISTTNEESTVSHESLSKKEQAKWTLILEVQKVYQQLGSIRQTAQHLKLSRTTVTKYIQLSEPPKQIRKPRVNQFLPYLNQITQWCQEGKTAIWIHEELSRQGFKGAPSSTRRKFKKLKQLFQ
ncbi:MAG: transposase [Turicibacter sp.]|nr:transposase [Turicibacter sp.]